ncbi:ankyrin repeat domain-containing protein SOWAHA [Engraulis encrasicolus]|uniref:ankyrin repeat domain-containing protein SOWAHA n=1 Tax=Engraulis encrasicolus TaxID=184585 RepID=UPI002FCF05CA
MGDVTEEALLSYIYSVGGRVKNADILKKYKPFISHNDLELRAKYREEFKAIIDRIAVVKSENGEKYLVLKKRYRQQLQDKERHDGQTSPATSSSTTSSSSSSPDEERTSSSAGLSSQEEQQSPACDGEGRLGQADSKEEERSRAAAAVAWDAPTVTITVTDEQEGNSDSGVERETGSLSAQVTPEVTDAEDEVDKESGSKSDQESDHEEECGDHSVALDPVEKEWLYSAACAQLSHLTHLLEMEPSLANKKDFTSFTALHWAAKHGKEDMTRAILDAGADVNSRAGYTPLHIAALHGHRHIMDLLIGTYGAKENLRDYSGHFANFYVSVRDSTEEDTVLHVPECHGMAQVSERKNRKLVSLFHSKKKWGSAEDLAPIAEERSSASATPHQLMLPAFRPRKFSR